MYPFIYKAEVYNSEYMEHPTKVSGITFADTFKEAVDKIEEYYGEELCDLYLAPLEASGLHEFPKFEMGDEILNAAY